MNFKKTIIIPIFHALDSRNILRTGILNGLEKENIRVVLLVPEVKADYYRNNFKIDNVYIESVGRVKEVGFIRSIRHIARMMYDSGSIYWFQKIRLEKNKKYFEYCFNRFISVLGQFHFLRSFIRSVFIFFAPKNIFIEYLKKYSPDLVFLPDIYATEGIYLGLSAKKENIHVIGMIRSWDNITSKGIALFVPDKLIVHNAIVKNEAIKILNMKEGDIEIVGLPHFDYYLNYNPSNKKDFFKKNNLLEGDRYLLFVPYLGTYTDGVNEILKILDEAIVNGKLPKNLKILLRFPPAHKVGFDELFKTSRIIFDYPGFKMGNGAKSDWEFTEKDMIHLADSIYYSSVVLNFASTITIDAAAFNKPVINIGFDGFNKKDFSHSIGDIYIVDHFSFILASGGTPLVKNQNDLIKTVNNYLVNPNIDQIGRKKIVDDQCWKLDGQSAKRLAEYLIKQLNK